MLRVSSSIQPELDSFLAMATKIETDANMNTMYHFDSQNNDFLKCHGTTAKMLIIKCEKAITTYLEIKSDYYGWVDNAKLHSEGLFNFYAFKRWIEFNVHNR